MSEKPRVNSKGQQELDKAQENFDQFQEQVKSLTVDEVNKAPILDFEPNTKLSAREIASMGPEIMKPSRTISAKEKFNEKFRKEWEEDKKYVKCIVENYEIRGENIEMWTKKYPGVPAEFWQLPVGKPIAVPRYVAQRIAECKYHVLKTEESVTSTHREGSLYGQLVAKHTVQRLDARPIGNSFVSMGS